MSPACGLGGAARATSRAARGGTLLVLDDIDGLAPRGVRRSPGSAMGWPRCPCSSWPRPRTRAGAPSGRTRRRARSARVGVAEVARRYAAGDEGRPGRMAGGGERRRPPACAPGCRSVGAGKAERRLAVRGHAATERARLQAAEDDLAGSVVGLQGLRDRARQDTGPGGRVPVQRVGVVRRGGRRGFLRTRASRGRDGGPLGGCAAGGRRRPFGERQVVGTEGRPPSRARCRGAAGQRALAVALLRPGEHPVRALERAWPGGPQAGWSSRSTSSRGLHRLRDEAERAAFVDALVARRATRVGARSCSSPCAPTSTAVAPSIRSCRDCWAPTTSLSDRCGATSCAGRSSSPPAAPACRSSPDLVDELIADVEGEAGRAAAALHRAARAVAASRRPAAAKSAYDRRAACTARSPGWPRTRTGGSTPPARDRTRILLRLADEGEGDSVVRRRVELTELEADRDERVAEVLTMLAGDRLVTIREGEVEVAHEALLREWPRLRRWLEQDSDGRRLHQHLRAAARVWDAGGRDSGELYRGARLAAALEWSAAHEPELNAGERPSWTPAAGRASAPSAACAPCSRASRYCSCSL